MTSLLPSQGLKFNYAKNVLLLQIHILFSNHFPQPEDEHHVNNLGEDVEVLSRAIFVQLKQSEAWFSICSFRGALGILSSHIRMTLKSSHF